MLQLTILKLKKISSSGLYNSSGVLDNSRYNSSINIVQRKGKKRKEKERKGKERKGKKRKGKERKRKGKGKGKGKETEKEKEKGKTEKQLGKMN